MPWTMQTKPVNANVTNRCLDVLCKFKALTCPYKVFLSVSALKNVQFLVSEHKFCMQERFTNNIFRIIKSHDAMFQAVNSSFR